MTDAMDAASKLADRASLSGDADTLCLTCRQPLLLGNYLLWREKHGRQQRSSAKPSPKASRLSTRKENIQQLQAKPEDPSDKVCIH